MPKAIELLQQGRNEELWQMCCGFLSLNIDEFMDVQERLLLKQLELLNNCPLGEKILRGAKPKTVEEFRQLVPLTTYKDYCPELLDKNEDILPAKPSQWVHTSGKSGEYPCKWVPLTTEFSREMSVISYGVGLLSSCKDWGDLSNATGCPKIVYAVAPRPYMSGAMAQMMEMQTPSRYMPPLEEAESLSFEERISEGFKQALSKGFDYFFGLSLVLVSAGNKFGQSSNKTAVLPLLLKPRALFRLIKGMLKAKLAKRPLRPSDLWSIKGIMSGGLDSWVYKDKIKELWGRYPLDVYAATECGILATQTWDYSSMTFIPNLNFLEFIPEDENLKWQMDRSYQPKTLLLNELEEGREYEIVFTNFHGGAMVRYRVGDMIRITSLRNERLGIEIPQMTFSRRADDIIDFGVTRLTEKVIWQAIENSGIPYEDWIARKETGENMALHIFLELKDGYHTSEEEVAQAVYRKILETDEDVNEAAEIRGDFTNFIDFKLEVTLLPTGTFSRYIEQRRAEGADLAHLKPPHINPSDDTLAILVTKPKKTGAVSETETETGRVTA
jgi:hypothetical protein